MDGMESTDLLPDAQRALDVVKKEFGAEDVLVLLKKADGSFEVHQDVQQGCLHKEENRGSRSVQSQQSHTLSAAAAAANCPKVVIGGRIIDLCG